MIELTRENLFQLSIFDVRKIAWDVGVQSPTLLRKEDCIDEIIAIKNGEKEPYIKKSKKGRPQKQGVSFVMNEDIPELKDWNIKFKQESVLKVSSADLSDPKILTGMLEITTEGYGFLQKGFIPNKETDIYIEQTFILRNKLKTGDVIEAVCQTNSQQYGYKVTNIIKINGQSQIEHFASKISFEIEKPSEFLCEIDNSKILKGQRVALNFDNKENKDWMLKLYSEVKTKKYFVDADCLEEEFVDLPGAVNVSTFDLSINKFRTVDFVVNRALRLAEKGEDITVFIVDIAFLPNAYMEYIKQGFIGVGFASDAILNTKQILSCAKKIKNGGSLSLIVGFNKDGYNSEICFDTLKSIFHHKI